MAKGKSKSAATGAKNVTPKTKTGGLPPSYYTGQSKKTKPQKDKNGDIIPG